MSLFEELKRRRVLRLIAAYVVVAWVLIEVVTTIEEPLGLPGWFDTAVIVLLGLGFPIAVIMSWVYDVTPDGVVREDGGVRPVQIDYGKIALVAVILLGAFLGGIFVTNTSQRPADNARPQDLQQFEINVPPEHFNASGTEQSIAISSDGKEIYLTGRLGTQRALFSRSMNDIELAAIKGTEGGWYFGISPSGKTIAFSSNNGAVLASVPANGGIVTDLARTFRRIREITWLDEDTLIYKDWSYDGLHRLTIGQSGEPQIIDSPVEGQLLKHVQRIPGSNWLILSIGELGVSPRTADRLAFMSPDDEIFVTDVAGASPKVAANGGLIFHRANALWHANVNIDELVIDNAVPLVDDVYYSYFAHYDISDRGDLVYRRDSTRGSEELVWVDQQGEVEPIPIKRGHYRYPNFDRSGDLLAIIESDASGPNLWVHSISRNEATRLTSAEFRETNPVWDVDGEHIFFESGASTNAFRVAIDGSDDAEQITHSPYHWWPWDITPDGQTLIIDEWRGPDGDGNNLGTLDMQTMQFQYLLRSDDRESHAVLSPDGSLIAYMSDRSGELEVYVRRFPFVDDDEIRVSNSGDCWIPRWNGDGTKVYCWDRDDETMYGTEISTSPSLQSARPVPLFSTEDYVFVGIGNYDYDVSRNRFVMIKKPPPGFTDKKIVLIQNWPALLEQQAP